MKLQLGVLTGKGGRRGRPAPLTARTPQEPHKCLKGKTYMSFWDYIQQQSKILLATKQTGLKSGSIHMLTN